MRWLRFLPPLAWMVVLAFFSGAGFGADRLGPGVLGILSVILPGAGPPLLQTLHVALRKIGHLVDYAILGALWWRALAARPGPASPGAWALILTVAYAGVDELRQALAPNRSPSVGDVLIDALGGLAGVASQAGPGRLGRRVLRLGLPVLDLWAAAAGLVVAGLALGRLARRWATAPGPEYDRPTPP